MLPKAYDPKAVEDRIYKIWEESGAFIANAKSEKEPFTITMPPPNATGSLHLGHAVMLALEDIFIRFQRMQGKEALWIPGTDHAAIATESFIIRRLQKEKKMKDPRAALGRDKLIGEIHQFVEESKDTIRGQVRKMGSSCDWSRERYTMEPALHRIVNEVFVKMYKDGLIYRGYRIVNWDPKLQTTVSDDEIEYEERTEPFYTFKYGPFEISTSRPETKFGDKYVVMHPDDKRYQKFVDGEKINVEWINGPVEATIIKDKAVDPEFGTGVMTITPWHDHVDFEIAERHKLKKEQVIGFDGKLLPIAGEFSGMPIENAREKIVEKMKKKGLLVKIQEGYVHNVALSQRGKGTIEPQIKEQWFIDVNKRVVKWKRKEISLKEVMQQVVKTGLIKIIPDHFEKTYFHWIDNLRDWCISRQIWWGHRIPVWYKNDRGALDTHVGVRAPEGEGWEQDPDTLDTWFSSALWTWSTLIDPELAKDPALGLKELLLKSPDFLKFHPTDVMETGYDILFFWVARMILMTTYVTGPIAQLEYGHVPFETVYLHGLIRTRDGRKMSKSDPDTMIDPLDMISKYGADALRLSMIVGQSPGNDSRLYEEKIAGYRNFVNKLWNASRFALLECEKHSVEPADVVFTHHAQLSTVDRAMLSTLQGTVQNVTAGLRAYRLSEVGEILYSFVWDYYCDWYLELSKGRSNPGVLLHVLRTILQLLHPYCPFATEELWSHVKPRGAGMLITQPWPRSEASLIDDDAERQIEQLIECVQGIRKIRADKGVAPTTKLTAELRPFTGIFQEHAEDIKRLAKLEHLHGHSFWIGGKPSPTLPQFVGKGFEVVVLMNHAFDPQEELKKLRKEHSDLTRYLAGIEMKLKNRDFIDKAPKAVVEGEETRANETREKLKKVTERLKRMERH